jgi:hypothetical protein
LAKTLKVLLDGLGVRVDVKFVLYQLPRNSRHANMLSCEDVSIFIKEFNEREFLFEIQIIPLVRDFRGVTRREWNSLAELVLQLDG